MPCTPTVLVTPLGGSNAALEANDCQFDHSAPLLQEEALVVAAALEAAAAVNVKVEVTAVSGPTVTIKRVEDPVAKTVVLVAIKDGPLAEVTIGPAIALARAVELRAAVGAP